MSQKQVLEDAMRQLEEIFVLYSRNTITDKGSVSQVNGTVLRSRQLSNSLTSNADDAVFLHKYATEVLPESIASSGAPGGDNPAQPKGAIIIYHNGQQDRGCRLEGTGDQITSGYVSPIKIADLMGNIAQSNTNVNKSVSNPKTNEPSLGLVEINSPFLSLPTRNVVPVALFCSSIPTLEMSRATPFVTVRVVSPMNGVQNERAKTLTIGSFLLGPNANFKEGTIERDIADSPRQTRLPNGVLVPQGSERGQQSVFGMEMFTMPQTLVNADRSVGARGTPILDKFKPLMSLNDVSVTIQPAGHAAFAYKEATVNITIHDRSRMQEVAQLLRPDQFGYNFIELEYGWTHPEDPGSDNPYAPFINSFRQRELYTVVSSNMSLGEGGSVSVSIRCALKGARDLLNMTPISDQWVSTTAAEEAFNTVNKRISDILAEKENYGPEDIRYFEIVRSVSKSGSSGRFGVAGDNLDQIKEFLSKYKTTTDGDLIKLREELVNVFGEDGTSGEFKKVIEGASQVFSKKLDSMIMSAELREYGKRDVQDKDINNKTIEPETKDVSRKYITLGKLVTCMFGSPMTKANFAEVQLYFYTFNTDAGAMNGRNIAEFPIPVQSVRNAFSEGIKTDPKMPLKKMMRIIMSLVNDGSSPAYGMQQPPKLPEGQEETKDQIKARNDTNSKSMEKYQCRSTSFKKPIIEYMMDSILVNQQPVLRVHFFDKRSTPNDEALFLLDVGMGTGPKELTSLVTTLQQGSSDNFTSILQSASSAGIVNVSSSKGKDTYTLNTNNRGLKAFIKRTVPSITYGTPTSMLKSFSVQSIDMQDFETALLIQAANGTRVPGNQQLDAPQNDMQIYPMSFSATILGCPLIDYAQEFFIDFDTGTSLDNVYVVNGISHKIAPGSFSTDLELKLTRTTGADSAIDSRIRTMLKSIDDKTKGTTPT
jgi:hypothetical protein